MKFSLSALVFGLAAVSSAAPTVDYFSGFNLGANHKSGACKTTSQWKQEFNKIKSWSTGGKAKFNVIKLFSTSDCNGLANAVPAAISAGVKLYVGVWNVDDAKFGREKVALEAALKKYPDTSKWLKGVYVGSESLYRKEIFPDKLAGQIYDVKGLVQQKYKATKIPVGTADTWTSWVNKENTSVVKACDVVIMNGFPYWQGARIQDGLDKLKKAIWDTRKAVGYNKPFVLGETGWPTKGPNFGSAVANTKNLQTYYKAAACWLQTTNYGWFWFSGFDEPNKSGDIEQNFGIALSDQKLKINLKC